MIHSIERRRSEVKELIRDQQRAAVIQAKGLLKRLEQEIAELRRRDTELEKLSQTEDEMLFLQLNRKCNDLLTSKWTNFSATVKKESLFEPQTRADFLLYSCRLTLDPNTAHKHLSLSGWNKKVSYGPTQACPDHAERFTKYIQVLCIEGLTARCSWEVDWSGEVGIAVSYKDISRKGLGQDGTFGNNKKSWMLRCSSGGYQFRHNNVETKVSGPQFSRVGVYLDHRAGTLSFYSISDTMTLLHRVHTTFTQPLYPGLGLGIGSKAEMFVRDHNSCSVL
ncbi:stonustoxin subunit beta-like [Aplochiton taeniatus]